MTDNILKSLSVRELASQKSISVFKDQEDTLKTINKTYNLNIQLSKLIRDGLDIMLKKLKEELEK